MDKQETNFTEGRDFDLRMRHEWLSHQRKLVRLLDLMIFAGMQENTFIFIYRVSSMSSFDNDLFIIGQTIIKIVEIKVNKYD